MQLTFYFKNRRPRALERCRKIGSNIIEAIDNSKEIDLARFIYALELEMWVITA